MELQKGIVLGEGRELALAVCLVALATGAAHATTYYSGVGESNGTTLSQIVKWYTDSGRTTLADLAPADATVAAKGLIAKSILPAAEGGTILAAADMPEGDEPMFSAVICTVPSTQADLMGTLTPAYIRGYKGSIAKDSETYASEGLVTYTATWVKTGLTVIFR